MRAVISGGKTFGFHTSALRAVSNEDIIKKSIKEAEDLSHKYSEHVNEAVKTWKKCNEIYYGKERDFENFPTLKVVKQHPPVRFGFIPDAWFQVFYDKTGVSGPYMFGIGVITYLLSKEIWIYDPHMVEIFPFVVCTTYLIKKFGPQITKSSIDYVEDLEKKTYHDPLDDLKSNVQRTIDTADEEIVKSKAVPVLVEAKMENLGLQLEAEYRSRLMQAHRAVTRRLDYHVAVESTRRKYQQEHMTNWIVDKVKESLSEANEKELLKQCIADLKNLGKA